MAVAPIGSAPVFPSLPALPTNPTDPVSSTGATAAANGHGFGDMVMKALDNVQSAQGQADSLAVQAATGNVSDIHNYMIAATQADLDTQLTVAVRNKALEAFTDIMRMPV